MFIITFFKSLVLPQYMARFKSMPLLVAIAIFFVSSFILAIPQISNISRARYELVDKQNAYHLQVFSNFDNDDLNVLRETSFNLSKSGLLFGDDITQGEIYTYDFLIENGDSKDFVRIVFDTYDVGNPELGPNPDVLKDFNNIPKPANGDNYLLILYGNSIIYSNPSSIKELKYNESKLVFSEIETGKEISYYLMDLYIPDINQQISFNTFISCVIYPLLIILLLWFFLRSSGSSFTFKEVYNIGSIAIIAPLIVFFIASWMLPKFELISFFSSIFGIYYLVMILIINSKRKIA